MTWRIKDFLNWILGCPAHKGFHCGKPRNRICPISNIDIAYHIPIEFIYFYLYIHRIRDCCLFWFYMFLKNWSVFVFLTFIISFHGVSSMRQAYPTYIIVPYELISLKLRNKGCVFMARKVAAFRVFCSCLHLYAQVFLCDIYIYCVFIAATPSSNFMINIV